MNTTKMNQDQFREMLKNPSDKPFVMLNLLKIKKEGGKMNCVAVGQSMQFTL